VFARDATPGEPPLRFDIATTPVAAEDTTGAGDAFDAGFIAGWLGALRTGHGGADALHRATMAGHRSAARHLRSPRTELPPG
jgi:sugar/nucleoside kinase (ribokinase family)